LASALMWSASVRSSRCFLFPPVKSGSSSVFKMAITTQPTRELAVAGRMRETVGAKRIALAPSTNYERQLLEDAFDR